MFCKYCGNRLDDGDRFCGACGHPVDEKPVQEAAPEKVYKKQEDEAPKIRKRNPEPEYDNRMTAGMGYGYRVDEDSDSEDDDEDDYEEEWEREEKKEKITFAVLGVIIVVLVVAIVFGVVKLVGAGGGDTKKVSQLNEQMKEDMQKSQERDDNETAEAAAEEPETVAPEVTATPEPTATPQPTEAPQDDTRVQTVIDMINALAGKMITADTKDEIEAARAAYDALTDAEKAKVTNYSVLIDAEQKLAAILQDKDNKNNSNNGTTDITDGNNATATQIGDPVYVTNMVSNLHAGKDFYLDSLKNNYNLTFSDDFTSVMDEIEKEYKEKNKLTDDTLLVRNWQDILAVYIYQQSKSGKTSFTMDSSCKADLSKIFEEMNPIVRDKQDITKVSYGNRKINYYIKKNNIAKQDRTVLKKYVETDCKLLCAVVTASKGFVRESVGDNVSEDRVDVIAAAYSLVGKVGYFWGGKSTVLGEDPSWGTVEKVSADGSKSSGTLRAYGLDCSGFVTWAVINGYQEQGMQAAVGDGTSDQWEKANVVSEADAQPGDLVFQRGPEAGSDNHVGILCGKTDSGDWIAVHCSSSKNGVTVGEAYSASFRYIRQPAFYSDTAVTESGSENAENTTTEDGTNNILTDVVKSTALKDALSSNDTLSDNLLEDFKNNSLQEDEDEDEIEDLTLDPESIDDAVETFDDAEALELEN